MATAFPANQPCPICSIPLQFARGAAYAGIVRAGGASLVAIERLDPAANAIVQKDAASAWRGASDSRAARPAPLEGALWLDEPFASVDATVAAAVLKAALMLAEVGPIVDESARRAFSFEEAWEVFAVLTHALIVAGLSDKARQIGRP